MAVITGIDRFEQRSSVKTWIMRILTNIARTRGAREHRSVPFASLEAEVADDAPEVAPAASTATEPAAGRVTGHGRHSPGTTSPPSGWCRGRRCKRSRSASPSCRRTSVRW